jgi:hypothetical protein
VNTVLLEAALIAAVVTPVAVSRRLREVVARIDRPRQAALAAMIVLTLASQLALHTRSFPFTNWHMYAEGRSGDPTVYGYDAELRSGRRVPLVPSRFLGPESADRMMEALRRGVERAKAEPSERTRLAGVLAAVASLYDDDHPQDPVATVHVSEHTVSIDSGDESPPRPLWAVRVP